MEQRKLTKSQEGMVLKNECIIYDVLKKMNLYRHLGDYYDIGAIGLVKGAITFDESKGYAVSTYLYRCVRNEILLHIRKENSVKNKSNKNTLSYDYAYNNDDKDELEFSNFIEDETQRIEEMLIKKEQIELLYKEILKLRERDRFIICSKYGLLEHKKLNQEQLAKEVGLSQSYVCRIIKSILEKLRENLSDFE